MARFNKVEARALLDQKVRELRQLSYAELRQRFQAPAHVELAGSSGVLYGVEIQAVWDDLPDGDLRVLVSIDDGGWRAFIPMTDGFIVGADGRFVGE